MRPMKGEDVMAFPPGFKAIAGNTLKRHFSDDLAGDAVTYACLGSNHNETNEFPPYNCPDGLRTQIYFPSCWNGEDDPINHSDHLAYPVHKNDAGHCPSSHPKKLPGLFIEVKYPTQKFAHLWNGDQHPFVLSNGDKTGYSFHSDFVNGWAPGAMEKLIACGPNQGDTSALSCPTLKTQGFYDREDCRLPKVVPEDVFTHSPELPGCNPIRADEQDIPVSEYRNCNKKPPLGPPFQEYTDVTQTLGWRYLGCAEDHLEHRSIGSWKWEPPSNNMTVQYCIQHCEECNQTVAGLQYGSECFCGTEQRMQGPTEGILRKCNIPCRGNSSQFCGGGVRNSVYVKCGGGPCRNVDFKLEVDY